MVSLVRNVHPEPDAASIVFKSAMRLLMGGVSVITAGRGAEIAGMTVTSLSSFATDPPSVVVSIDRQSSSWPLIRRHGAFGVNILASDQVDTATRFSGQDDLNGAARFENESCTTLISGVPLLTESLAVFDCAVDDVVERYSHVLLIGSVRDLRISPDKHDGLAYSNGRFISVEDNEEALQLAAVSGPSPRSLWQV
jgi:flavin reductase (DIM6/NTAB) family NADH-FMN oxidoreductase RutF